MTFLRTTSLFALILTTSLAVISIDAVENVDTAAGGKAPSLDALIASMAGGWAGENNTTPFGPMPFAIIFDWEEDGSLHGRSHLNSETYIDLLFRKDQEGRWLLREEAGMEGQGVHAYELVPTAGGHGTQNWIHSKDPDFLSIDLELDDASEPEKMILDVRLRGRDHIRFELARLSEEEVPELRKDLEAQALQAPDEGTSIREIIRHPDGEDTPDPIAAARQGMVDRPEDATAHLAFAKALSTAIQADPMTNGARYSGDMARALERAIELDPTLVEAYHWLAGYYLSAPSFAGGSPVQAKEVAARLGEIDPDQGRELLTRIEERLRSEGRSE